MLTTEEIREGAAGWDGLRDTSSEGIGLALWSLHDAVHDALDLMARPRPGDRSPPPPRDQCQRAHIYFATRDSPADADSQDDGEVMASMTGWVLRTSADALKFPMRDESERGVFDWKVGDDGPGRMVENVVIHQAWLWLTWRGFRVSDNLVLNLAEMAGPYVAEFADKVRRWEPPELEGGEG